MTNIQRFDNYEVLKTYKDGILKLIILICPIDSQWTGIELKRVDTQYSTGLRVIPSDDVHLWLNEIGNV